MVTLNSCKRLLQYEASEFFFVKVIKRKNNSNAVLFKDCLNSGFLKNKYLKNCVLTNIRFLSVNYISFTMNELVAGI